MHTSFLVEVMVVNMKSIHRIIRRIIHRIIPGDNSFLVAFHYRIVHRPHRLENRLIPTVVKASLVTGSCPSLKEGISLFHNKHDTPPIDAVTNVHEDKMPVVLLLGCQNMTVTFIYGSV